MKYIKNFLILLLIWLGISQNNTNADNRIIVYLREAPAEIITQALDDATAEMKNDDLATSVQKIKNFQSESLKSEYKKLLTPKLSGFVSIYGGYLDISNKNGIIQFPLRQFSKKMYIAFTEKIKLIRVKDNTISHREFADPAKHKTSLYVYEKKIDAKKNYYWSVEKTNLPQDRKISPLTMVIFTNPSNVFVQTGEFLSNDSQHFVLPEIYVINTKNQALTNLSILKVKRFFEPVKFEEKPVTEKSTQGMLNNS
ncbi:MAG: hypothetical protein US49_C0002G0134 [candidate division TM6 bacterium GW2011_GWF2_37_49]|nr:MAG: hypothetical protein US49_C0002G0134 [candidate division TM6 bacterium GW2011_GWF2_37_49]